MTENVAAAQPNPLLNPNGATPQNKTDAIDYKAEAQFWQLKYFELMIHSNQIITALSRPMLTEQAMAQLQAQAAQAAQT